MSVSNFYIVIVLNIQPYNLSCKHVSSRAALYLISVVHTLC